MNDYNSYKHLYTASTEICWFGHPNDSPHDVRARQFVVLWRGVVSETIRRQAAAEGQVVARWELLCRGACSVDGGDDGTEGEDIGDRIEGEVVQLNDEKNDDPKVNIRPTRHQRCQHGSGNKPVRLVVSKFHLTKSIYH